MKHKDQLAIYLIYIFFFDNLISDCYKLLQYVGYSKRLPLLMQQVTTDILCTMHLNLTGQNLILPWKNINGLHLHPQISTSLLTKMKGEEVFLILRKLHCAM